jgi:5-methylthioadenosine/S-adenosylhomocysteine deaminase
MKPDILITNICLPADGKEQAVQGNCSIALSGDTIEEIGLAADFRAVKAKTIINGQGNLALPGLVNGHCHAAMTLFRGLADDLQLMEWLNDHIFPAEAAHVNSEMVYWCTRLAAAEMILSGTTTVADGYFHEHEAARAFADAGMRAIVAQAIIDFPAPGVPDPTRKIQVTADFIDQWQQEDSLISPAVFAHSPYTCSPETLQQAKTLARDKGVLFFIHLAESRFEADMVINSQSSSPVRHLHSLGILDRQTVCIHCVHPDEEDMDILAASGAAVVTCPQSNMKLASGIAPVQAMLAKGIRLGLGTDGAASNNGLDMFREMDLCAKLHKLPNLDPVAVPAAAVLQMATSSGAAALGMQEEIGTLAPGMKADIILVDSKAAHLQPLHGLDLLVYAAGGADVQTVLINGQLVMENRKFLSFDLAETMEQVRRLARQVKG